MMKTLVAALDQKQIWHFLTVIKLDSVRIHLDPPRPGSLGIQYKRNPRIR